MLLAVTVLAGGLAACTSPAGGSASPSASFPGAIEHASGDALVLRMGTDGGFVAPGSIFTWLPQLSILGDGRLITQGPVDAVYPGPALPNLRVRRLSESGLQSVLRTVLSTGLFEANASYDAAARRVMDGPTTVFTLDAAGRHVRVSIYALGLVDDLSNLTDAQPAEIAAYRDLASLALALGSLEARLPAGAWLDGAAQAFAPRALRLRVSAADDEVPPVAGMDFTFTPWPVSAPPGGYGSPDAAGSRCAAVDGAEARAWLSVLASANALTRFTHAGHRYRVEVRPLLPDEPVTCASTG